ncbi:MAG: hypothetical protein NVS1B7_3740 [Candidatus Saccharimonadales bacterium]
MSTSPEQSHGTQSLDLLDFFAELRAAEFDNFLTSEAAKRISDYLKDTSLLAETKINRIETLAVLFSYDDGSLYAALYEITAPVDNDALLTCTDIISSDEPDFLDKVAPLNATFDLDLLTDLSVVIN